MTLTLSTVIDNGYDSFMIRSDVFEGGDEHITIEKDGNPILSLGAHTAKFIADALYMHADHILEEA